MVYSKSPSRSVFASRVLHLWLALLAGHVVDRRLRLLDDEVVVQEQGGEGGDPGHGDPPLSGPEEGRLVRLRREVLLLLRRRARGRFHVGG